MRGEDDGDSEGTAAARALQHSELTLMTLDADDKTHAPRGSTKPAIRDSGLAVPILSIPSILPLFSLYSLPLFSLPFSHSVHCGWCSALCSA